MRPKESDHNSCPHLELFTFEFLGEFEEVKLLLMQP